MTSIVLGHGPHRIVGRVFPDVRALGKCLAAEILDGVRAARAQGRRFLLGCPGGRSLQSTYRAMGEQAGCQRADLSHVVLVMMDEYVNARAGGFAWCAPDAHFSCRRFAREQIQAVLNAGLEPGEQLPDGQIWFPDPARPDAYEERIAAAGGIDLFLIASGASDGHVAFNPPGSSGDTRTRIVRLADSTRCDNTVTFPEFASAEDVPRHGVTVGLGTIRQSSRRVVLVMHGADKCAAAARLAACGGFDPRWPASIIFLCRQPAVYVDETVAAAVKGAS